MMIMLYIRQLIHKLRQQSRIKVANKQETETSSPRNHQKVKEAWGSEDHKRTDRASHIQPMADEEVRGEKQIYICHLVN